MSKSKLFSLFFILALSSTLIGCASKDQKRQIRVLEAQVGAITEELVRLDESLRDTRTEISEEESRRSELAAELSASESRLGALREEENVIRGIYRTPSGFTLPSVKIQEALKGAGYYKGSLDGKIGSGTRSAIKAFQSDNGLVADGIVGQRTWEKLKVYVAAVK